MLLKDGGEAARAHAGARRDATMSGNIVFN